MATRESMRWLHGSFVWGNTAAAETMRTFELATLNKSISSISEAVKSRQRQIRIIKWLSERGDAVPCDLLDAMVRDGDIVLFRQRDPMARCQRFFVNSEYNHVAIVYREAETHRARVLESNIQGGVQSFPIDAWLQMKNRSWCKTNFDRLAIRQLRVDRTPEMRKALLDFVAEVEGKSTYALPLSMIKTFFGVDQTGKGCKALFCSELVAAAYQRIGILDDASPSAYMPGDFGTSSNGFALCGCICARRPLRLSSAASLTREHVIAFPPESLCESVIDDLWKRALAQSSREIDDAFDQTLRVLHAHAVLRRWVLRYRQRKVARLSTPRRRRQSQLARFSTLSGRRQSSTLSTRGGACTATATSAPPPVPSPAQVDRPSTTKRTPRRSSLFALRRLLGEHDSPKYYAEATGGGGAQTAAPATVPDPEHV